MGKTVRYIFFHHLFVSFFLSCWMKFQFQTSFFLLVLCLFQFTFNLLGANLFIWMNVSCEIISRYFARKFFLFCSCLHGFCLHENWLYCAVIEPFFLQTLALFAVVLVQKIEMKIRMFMLTNKAFICCIWLGICIIMTSNLNLKLLR